MDAPPATPHPLLDLARFDQTDELLYQVSGPAGAPVLVYVPGIHGDWTPTWRLRRLLADRFRVIEVAYPRAPEWDLPDYVDRLLELFDRLALPPVHLLAESFGSLVGWEFTRRHPGRVRTLVIAGGICRTPGRGRVAWGRFALRLTPVRQLDWMLDRYYAWLSRQGRPTEAGTIEEFFPAARTRRGWQAVARRLKIIRDTDLRPQLAGFRLPVLYLGGARDRVVPVRREVACLARALGPDCCFTSHLLPGAPHAIIPACPRPLAALLTDWIARHEPAA